MTKDVLQKRIKYWQQKTDEEIIAASKNFSRFAKEAEEIVRAEMRRRKIPEPEPTIRTVLGEQSKQPTNLAAISIVIGIIVLVIGLVLIIKSPSLVYQQTGAPIYIGGYRTNEHFIETRDFRNSAYYGGVFLLIIGGILSAVGFGKYVFTQTVSPSAPSTQPDIPMPVSPKSIELGNTPYEVQLVMGNPDKIIDLRTQVIHIYKDMKIIYVDGKVSDVQLP